MLNLGSEDNTIDVIDTAADAGFKFKYLGRSSFALGINYYQRLKMPDRNIAEATALPSEPGC